MTIHHIIRFENEQQGEIFRMLKSILHKQNLLMANDELALADLAAIKTQLQKIGTESAASLAKIIALEEAAANAGVPQSVLDAIADVKAQAQLVDDLVPDAPTPQV